MTTDKTPATLATAKHGGCVQLGTPSSRWASAGEPDPHGNRYDCERAALAMGDLSDDELANAVFMHGDQRPSMAQLAAGVMLPIAYLTAAKDRIRWLSRALVAAQAEKVAQPYPGGQGDARSQFEEYRGGGCERDAQGYYTNARTAQDWAMWQAALAARQPVEEPVVYVPGLYEYAPYFECTPEQWERHTKSMTDSGKHLLANMLAHHCLLARRDDRGWIITRFDLIRSGKPWWHVSNDGVLTYDYDPETKARAVAARQPETDEQYADEQALIDHLDSLMDDGGQGGEKWEPAQAAIAGIIAARQPVGLSDTFQHSVSEWMDKCFLPSLYSNMTERGDRLLEEVLELLQAHGYDKARVPTLVDYVFSRPVGDPAQEVGGVMVTLAGYCWVAGLDMHVHGHAELARISHPEVMAKIQAKQEAKNALHFDTPLPGNAVQPAQAVDLGQFREAVAYAARSADFATHTGIGDKLRELLALIGSQAVGNGH